jgi:Na+/proline symporter
MESSAKVLILLFSFGMIVISLLIGLWAKRKVTSNQAYFGSTGLFGPLAVGLSSTAAVASAFALVGVPGLIYNTGNAMNFWMLSSAAFAMAYLIIGKKVRAMAEVGEVASLGDISDLRFNNSRLIKFLLSVIIFLGCIAYLAAQIKAGSELFNNLLGWNPIVTGLVIFGILTVYTAISGEVGGLMTQAFQGLVMVIGGVIIIVSFFVVTGGFGNVMTVVSNAGTVSVGDVSKTFGPDFFNAWGVLPRSIAMAWVVIPILGTVGQPQVLTRMYALKNPKDMPKLGLYAGIAHMIVGFFALVVAYGAVYLVATGKIAPLAKGDLSIFAFADYLGLYAQLFVYAAILAAAMSSASMFLTLSGNIIARDLPSSLGFSFKSDAQQMKVARITIFGIGLMAILFSLGSSEMVAILGTFGWGTLMSGTFPVFIIGLLWKKANRIGVSAGLLLSLGLNVLSLFGMKWPGALPWYVNVVALSVFVTVVVSLVTKEEKMEEKVSLVMEL